MKHKILLGCLGLALTGIIGIIVFIAVVVKTTPVTAEQKTFMEANIKLMTYKNSKGFGNTEKAKKLADMFSDMAAVMVALGFEKDKEDTASTHDQKFITHCQLNEDSVCFLVHVPQFKRYKGEVRDDLIKVCWDTAKLILGKKVPDDIELAVGVRGNFAYGGSAIGKRETDKPVTENSFLVAEGKFYKYFKKTAEKVAVGEAKK